MKRAGLVPGPRFVNPKFSADQGVRTMVVLVGAAGATYVAVGAGTGVTTVAAGVGFGCSCTSTQPARPRTTSGSRNEVRIGRILQLRVKTTCWNLPCSVAGACRFCGRFLATDHEPVGAVDGGSPIGDSLIADVDSA